MTVTGEPIVDEVLQLLILLVLCSASLLRSCRQMLSDCSPMIAHISAIVASWLLSRSCSASVSWDWGSDTRFLDRASGALLREPFNHSAA